MRVSSRDRVVELTGYLDRGLGLNIDTKRARLADKLGKVADGDRSALKDVYELTAAKLMGVILPIARDRDRSEDILQDVYLKVWHRAGRYEAGKGSPIT